MTKSVDEPLYGTNLDDMRSRIADLYDEIRTLRDKNAKLKLKMGNCPNCRDFIKAHVGDSGEYLAIECWHPVLLELEDG